MKIEKAIQSSFKSESEKMVVNIIYTSNWINYQHSHIFKSMDLSMQQYNVLRILKGQLPNAATVNLLIERMLDKSSNASRIVEKLRSKGLVERKACPKDRRRVDIKITDEGLKILAEATAEMQKYTWAEDNLTTKEAQELNRLLNKLRTNKQEQL
jgi:DNA-binding MarR family transcriptional regulator